MKGKKCTLNSFCPHVQMNRNCTCNSRDGHKWNSYAEFPHTFGLTRKHGNASNEDGQIYTSPKTYTFEPDLSG